MENTYHEYWMSRHVCVVRGPFTGWEGQICATDGPTHGRVEVAFPKDKPNVEQIWFDSCDLIRITGIKRIVCCCPFMRA